MRLYKQLQNSISDYGLLPVVGTMRHTMELVADEAEKRIEEMPDGIVRHAFHFDSTSREPALIKINVSFTVKGNKIIVSFKGSSPEIHNRAINCPLTMTKLGIMVGVNSFFWPDLPKSPAILQHFDFEFDPNSMMACTYDVPIAMNVQTGFKCITAAEILFSKLSYGLPNKYASIKAPWYNQPAGMMYGGITQHGHEVGNVCADLNGMAGGARWNRDGEHSICANFAQMCDIGESEGTEEDLPVVMLSSKRFTPDVGSFGKFRGGAGYQTLYTRYGKNTFGFQAVTTGSKFPSALGMFGGYSSPCYPIAKVKGMNLFEIMKENPKNYDVDLVTIMNDKIFPGATYETVPGSMEFELAFEGELYALYQGAGGGYGDVLERDPQLVMKDLKERLISSETARDLYCVVFTESTFIVDDEATKQRRSKERKSRLSKGMKWDDFIDSEVKKSPPIGILYFGSWNLSEEIYGGMYRAKPGEFPREIMLPDSKLVYEAVLKRKVVSGFTAADGVKYDPLTTELTEAAHPKTLAKLARVMGLLCLMIGRIVIGGIGSLFAGNGNKLKAFQKKIGKALAKFMHDSGPTFIKLGQVLSTRPDLLSRNVTDQMASLQDDVDPMDSDLAMKLIEEGLGRPLADAYKTIERDPLAAGSVAQVHKAVMHDGTVVAVKVMRPNLEESVSNDLRALSALVGFARRCIPGVAAINPRELIDELGKAVRGQMDFQAEIDNNRRFARELKHLEWLKLPEIYDELCSDSVITMEFVSGKSPAQYIVDRGEYDHDMAEKVYRMYIEMAFGNRFLHADLHSGNIMIGDGGQVILIDTGLAHEFPGYYVKRYLRAYLCVAAVDGYLQADNYLGDRPHLATPEVREVFSHDMHVMYQTWHKTGAKDLTTLWVQIMGICHKHRIPLDRELLMMMVADITMSGIVHEFDPEFDAVEFVRQELPRLVFQEGKLALDDPFLLAASRRDLLKDIRSGMGIDTNVDELVAKRGKK
jgi:predicted unusual protein kinase regulating ubiquinone biosynthesis (AarF/ABC1/UbiB family)/N-methylhydantoinase B/oxoprolinase/acetone carboxylase alpha subunit